MSRLPAACARGLKENRKRKTNNKRKLEREAARGRLSQRAEDYVTLTKAKQAFPFLPQVLNGETADVYFLRTRQVLQDLGIDPRVG
ncbi:MAG TPA: hypothetical protein VFA78_05640, partial [Chloroflexota bacterium]|nr:hypothetical protein [Chloroflexota bacterium]